MCCCTAAVLGGSVGRDLKVPELVKRNKLKLKLNARARLCDSFNWLLDWCSGKEMIWTRAVAVLGDSLVGKEI
jgi:hypothetical protein